MQIKNPYCESFIDTIPADDLSLIVTIPCHNEPNLIGALESLLACDPINGSVEIIVIINHAENAPPKIVQQNKLSFEKAKLWAKRNNTPTKTFHIHLFDALPKKHAGVGLARKIAMDEAASRFLSLNKKNGIIQCYDADCSCLPNLMQAIQNGFDKYDSSSLGIYYEHPIVGNEYSEATYRAIISYELHLRYYHHIQQYIGLPFAYQTIGSSMAVRAEDYILQGGMNKRKAGEDFYFLQKFISLNQHREINDTMVIPSPRTSDRVPFGTGKAVNDLLASNNNELLSYNPEAFDDLKILIDDLENLFNSNDIKKDFEHWPLSLISYFIEKEKMPNAIFEIKHNTSNFEMFEKRFYKWMNAFKLMKYLHFSRDQNIFPDIPIIDAADIFIHKYLKKSCPRDEKSQLIFFRNMDKE